MSELTDEQITDLIQKERRSHGHVERNVARSAYALGREAGLKEAAKKCEWMSEQYPTDVFPEHGVSKDCESARWARRVSSNCAKAIRALIATPSDSPADVKTAGQTEASQ